MNITSIAYYYISLLCNSKVKAISHLPTNIKSAYWLFSVILLDLIYPVFIRYSLAFILFLIYDFDDYFLTILPVSEILNDFK